MVQVVLRGPGDIAFQEVPVPIPAPGEVLIRNRFCGICGTDVHRFSGRFSLFGGGTLHLGHEVSGTVEAVGEDTADLAPGDSVVIDPNFPCGYCEACRKGRQNHCHNMRTIGTVGPAGLSDLSIAPRTSVHSFNSDRLRHESAVFAEPLACVLHGLEQLGPDPARRALVIGSGTMGLLFLQALRLYGLAEISVADIRADRLAVAHQLGTDHTIHIEPGATWETSLPGHRHGYDYVVDCTGNSEVTENAVSLLDDGGRLLVFGVCAENAMINVSPYELFRRDLQVIGAFSLAGTMAAAVRILEAGKIRTDPLIDSIRPRDTLVESIQWLAKGNGEGRVILAI